MKHNSIYYHTALIGLAATMMVACSNDEEPVLQEEHTVPLTLCSPANANFMNGDTRNAAKILTRADHIDGYFVPGTPNGGAEPTDIPSFVPYNKLYPTPVNKDFTTIGAFLVKEDKDQYTSPSGYFKYVDENQWSTTVGVKAEPYYLFGYMPSNVGSISAQVDKLTETDVAGIEGGYTLTGSWADGAKMTIRNLNTVTPADVCVVVGVKKAPDGFDREHPWSINDATYVVPVLQQGQYSYTGTEDNNYVYLLLDHLYTNVNMELAVEEKYAELRTIVLKEVYMKTPVRNTVDVVVTLTNDAKKPIQDIHIDAPTGDTPTRAQIFPADPKYATVVAVENHGKPTSVPGYFAPGQTTQSFDFEFHYDVYDKAHPDDPENFPYGGNLVREDCIAINKWTLPGTGVQNGKSFKVKATIRPTYLFMLSDPDLDNPTIELNTEPNNP